MNLELAMRNVGVRLELRKYGNVNAFWIKLSFSIYPLRKVKNQHKPKLHQSAQIWHDVEKIQNKH